VVVTLLGQEIARISAPVREVEVRVPVPGPTQLVPGPTDIITIPGPTRTATIPVPGPTTTVTAPGATTTVTLRPSARETSEARDRIESSTTPAPNMPAPSATAIKTSPPRTVVEEREKRVTVTVPQAIGISLGLLLLGLLLGLAAVYAAYAVGYKNSEQADLREWRKFTNELFGKRKH